MDKRKLLPILVAGALLFGAVGAVAVRTVSAQVATPTAPSTPDQSAPSQGLKGPRGGKGGFTDADLAAALGITEEQLQAAYTTARDEALTQAVDQGLITQAQADQIAQQQANGRLRLFGHGLLAGQIDYNALLADALGVSVDELNNARVEAMNTAVERAVSEGTITQEQADLIQGRQALANDSTFKSAMQSAYEAAVAQAVQSGLITQAQADAILAAQAQRQSEGPGFFDGSGGPGGHGHHGPGGADFFPQQQPPADDFTGTDV